MTLKEAMIYRGENESTLALMLATRPLDVRRWCKPGGLEKLSAQRLQQLAKAECPEAAAAGKSAGWRGTDHRRRCGV